MTFDLATARLILTLPQKRHGAAIAAYYTKNRKFLTPFEPLRPEPFYTPAYWQRAARVIATDYDNRTALRLMLQHQDHDDVIGMINFTGVEGGNSYSFRIGYSLDEAHQNQGYMTEALDSAIRFMFGHWHMHRATAAVMPKNAPSRRVLTKLGFDDEGLARDYLQINGQWEDHILMALINPFWIPPEHAHL